MDLETLKCLIAEQPEAFGLNEGDVSPQLVETHISLVVLTDSLAFKFKKAVDLGFLDYSTPEIREKLSKVEYQLNSQFCPKIYLGVQMFNVSGTGAIEVAVKMRRFPRDNEFVHLLEKGKLNDDIIKALADKVASIHIKAEISPDQSFGSLNYVSFSMKQNFEQMEHIAPSDIIDIMRPIQKWSLEALSALSPIIEQRQRDGFIKHCHGDLHLGNIIFFEGEVELFDCIEFNDHLRIIDTMNEIAFLMMDLEDHGQNELANVFLNRYLDTSGDYEGIMLLCFYKVYRAMVRAKVALMAHPPQCQVSHSYLSLAASYIKPRVPVVLLTFGVSGSGKSFVASTLARKMRILHIRSDIERKRLKGLSMLEDSHKEGLDIYDSKSNARTYERLLDVTKRVACANESIIVDACFLKKEQREPFLRLHGCKLVILHCKATEETLIQRIHSRHDDPSEASMEVLQLQLKNIPSPLFSKEEIQFVHEIDTEHPIDYESLITNLCTNSLFIPLLK